MFAQLTSAFWAPAAPRSSRRSATRTTTPAAAPAPHAVRDDKVDDIGAFISGLRIATLTITDRFGMMHSCPVTTLQRDFDGEVWLPVHRSTPIVEHLRESPGVLVTYLNGLTDRCLTLHGTARFDLDADAVRPHWHRGLAPWFTQGPDDPEMVAIRVRVVSADLWE